MTILQEIKQYAEYCLTDKYINEFENYLSCQKHKWACQRFLNDLKRIGNEDFSYIWNEEQAQKIVKWFTYLRHSKGELAGTPIHLTLWQKFCICQIYGWVHKDTGYKRFTKSFMEVGRKNAKSQMESGIALYELACSSTKNKEVYEICCAGVKRKQSKIVFDECKLMLKESPLSIKFKVSRDSIVHIKTGSTMQPLSKEDGQKGEGGNIALMIIDEYKDHPTDEFYTMAVYGQNTKEPLLMIITTAGRNLNYPCYTQEYKYCSQILNPEVIEVSNDTYFVDILELDTGDNEDDFKTWYKANPVRMTYEEGQKKIREAYDVAKEIPEKMPDFKTKCLNVWVQARNMGYMDMAKWNLCQVDKIPYDLTNQPVYVGLDMSAKIDLTSVAFIIPIMDNGVVKYVCFSHSFIPSVAKLQERMKIDKVPYDSWLDDKKGRKYLSLTNSEIVDQTYVMNYVQEFCEANKLKIHTLCFDPNNASKMMLDMSNEGYTVAEVWQSHKSLNEATAGFREQVYSKNVLYTYNPLLNFAMSNAVIKPNNGLIKIDKDATIQRVDPVDAMLCAYKLALFHHSNPVDKVVTGEDIDDFYAQFGKTG